MELVRKLSTFATIAVASMWFVPAASAQIREVEVTGGKVAGVVEGTIASFKGVPFAAPPVGALRWKAPQPVPAWTGVKQASQYGPSCMQDPTFAKIFLTTAPIGEDCLYLNVWTPAKSQSDRLPVMVWIYGGGFVGGMTSAPAYDGTRLAEKGVVLVSIAYRLGVFGFLAHPELTKESGRGSGTYGVRDMVAGLQWVQANIAGFGGDPSRVTIFGESAGGIAVSMLAASPAAKGLFHRAISESGGNFGPPRFANEGGANVPPLTVAEAAGKAFLAKLGANGIAAARALSAQALQTAVGPGLQGGFWPVFDGDLLPGDQYELYRAGRFNDAPVLIGTNSDEGALFAPPGGTTPAMFESLVRAAYGKHSDSVLAVYPHATNEEAAKAARDVFRDAIFAWPTWAWATLQSQGGTSKAYVYYFDHRNTQSPNGANHGAEIAYVFKTLGAELGPLGLPAPPRPEDLAMSDLVSSYWVNFAKTGDPNGPGLPEWPAFTIATQNAMHFDPQSSARPLPNMTQLKALDGYFAWRREEARARK
jgi:para-nitrobenzyl esterase